MRKSFPIPACLPPMYSWNYAEYVVDGFINSYSRVLVFVAKKLGMNPKDLAYVLKKLFRYQNTKFQIIREMLKRIEKRELYDDLAPLSRQDFLKYLTSVKSIVEDDWLDGVFFEKRY